MDNNNDLEELAGFSQQGIHSMVKAACAATLGMYVCYELTDSLLAAYFLGGVAGPLVAFAPDIYASLRENN